MKRFRVAGDIILVLMTVAAVAAWIYAFSMPSTGPFIPNFMNLK